MATEQKKIKVLSLTSAAFAAANPTLLQGQHGFETDTGKFKIGDGSTAWNSISTYYVPNGINGISNLGTGQSVLKDIVNNQLRGRTIKAADSSIAISLVGDEVRIGATGVGAGDGVPQVFDVRSYGAVVNGTTDDTAAVNSALADAETYGGGIIYIPRGKMKTSGAISLNAAPNYGQFVFAGEGGATEWLMTGLGSNIALSIANAGAFVMRDMVLSGSVTGSESSNSADSAASIIDSNAVEFTVFENVIFAGLGTSASGVDKGLLNMRNTMAVFKNTFFGGCTAPDSAVVNLHQSRGLSADTAFWFDYVNYKGIFYNKVFKWDYAKHWIRATNPQTLDDAAMLPLSMNLRNCQFDEATTDGAVYADLNSSYSARLQNISMNAGLFDMGGDVGQFDLFNFRNMRRVKIEDAFCGYRATGGRFGVFHNVARVVLENLQAAQGADSIELTGTTARLDQIQCSGYTVTNTAGATINTD